jgi:hypothetical protein
VAGEATSAWLERESAVIADYRRAGQESQQFGGCRIPARTAGLLGCRDHADADFTTSLGDAHSSLDLNDWGEPAGGHFGYFARGRACHADDVERHAARVEGVSPPERAAALRLAC